jgi:hypothetical protein
MCLAWLALAFTDDYISERFEELIVLDGSLNVILVACKSCAF